MYMSSTLIKVKLFIQWHPISLCWGETLSKDPCIESHGLYEFLYTVDGKFDGFWRILTHFYGITERARVERFNKKNKKQEWFLVIFSFTDSSAFVSTLQARYDLIQNLWPRPHSPLTWVFDPPSHLCSPLTGVSSLTLRPSIWTFLPPRSDNMAVFWPFADEWNSFFLYKYWTCWSWAHIC